MMRDARESDSKLASGNGAAPAGSGPIGGRGIFDHLTDIILQGQPARSASAPSGAAGAEQRRPMPRAVHVGPSEGSDPFAGRRQTFLFRETAEKLVVEKEVFVREEVVVSKLIEDHVRQTKPAPEAVAAETPAAPPPVQQPVQASPEPPPPAQPQAAAAPPPPAAAPSPAPEPQRIVFGGPEEAEARAQKPQPEPPRMVFGGPEDAAARASEQPRLVFGGPEDAAARASEQPRLVFGGPEDAAARPLKRPVPQPARSAPSSATGGSGSLRWLAYLLLFCLAGLIAFYGGQLLGTLWAGPD